MRSFIPFVLASVLMACGPQVRDIDDAVELCVGTLVIQGTPDRALEATITFATCEKDCDSVESAECEVTEADGVVSVTGETRVIREGRKCGDECTPITATCDLTLAPGDYLVEASELSMDVSHPVLCSDCVEE